MALSLKERKKYNGTFFEGKEKSIMAISLKERKKVYWHFL